MVSRSAMGGKNGLSPIVTRMFERLSQLVPGAVDVGLHGPQGQIERRGNFFVRSAFDVTKHDAGSILGSKAGDRSLDGRPELARLHFVERRFLLSNDVEG